MPTITTTKTDPQTALVQNINERINLFEQELAKLKEQAQLARGSSDVTQQARAATLPDRIERALRSRPLALDELARELDEAPGRVSTAMRPLRRKVYNAGSAERPQWFWILGDDTPSQPLYAAVEALMRTRPISHAELCVATGARANRVSGAINEMRRTKAVINVSDGARARWFIVPEGVALARLSRADERRKK